MTIDKKRIKYIIPSLLAIITFLMSLVFKTDPAFTENYFSQGIYPKVSFVMSYFSGLFPFSLDDVFYTILVVLFLLSMSLVVLRKLRIKKFLLYVIQVVVLIYVVFYWFWGFNYYRQDAHVRLNIPESKLDENNFVSVFKWVVSKANQDYKVSDGLENVDYQTVLEDSYKELQSFLKIDYPSGKRRIKNITYSDFFAQAGVLGYFGPFFNEVHVNEHLSVWDRPVVTAHEMAHQFGVTSEAEANFYAWRVCINGQDDFVKYSGWLYALNLFIYESRHMSSTKEVIKTIRPEVVSDYRSRRKYWRDLTNTKINKAAGKVNDVYLKSNRIEKGVDDYNDMVQLIIDLYLVQEKDGIFN